MIFRGNDGYISCILFIRSSTLEPDGISIVVFAVPDFSLYRAKKRRYIINIGTPALLASIIHMIDSIRNTRREYIYQFRHIAIMVHSL